MPAASKHYVGAPYYSISGLPFYVARLPQSSFIRHDHEFIEIVCVVGGTARHQIDGTHYPISAGDILVIPMHHSHTYQDTDHLEIINALFDPAALVRSSFDLVGLEGYRRLFLPDPATPAPSKHKGRLRIPAPKFAIIQSLFSNFITEIERKLPGYQAMAATSFIQAIGVLVRCYEHIDTPPLLISSIEHTLDFMESHYGQSLSLDQLAALAHMSRSTYQRHFRRLMNTSPIDYLILLRIRKAAALLSLPELNITEIAFRAGFSDSNYFARKFKQIVGRSPQAFHREFSRGGKGAARNSTILGES